MIDMLSKMPRRCAISTWSDEVRRIRNERVLVKKSDIEVMHKTNRYGFRVRLNACRSTNA